MHGEVTHQSARRRRGEAALRVLEAVAAVPPGSQRELANYARVSTRTVSSVVKSLAPERVLAVDQTTGFGVGAGVVLSFSVGTEHLSAALISAGAEVLVQAEAERDVNQLDEKPEYLLKRLRRLALEVLGKGLDEPKVLDSSGRIPLLGVTVAWPVPVDWAGFAPAPFFVDDEWQRMTLTDGSDSPLAGLFLSGSESTRQRRQRDGSGCGIDSARARVHDPPHDHSDILVVVRIGVRIGSGTLQLPRIEPHGPSSFARSRLIVGNQGPLGPLVTYRSATQRSANGTRRSPLVGLDGSIRVEMLWTEATCRSLGRGAGNRPGRFDTTGHRFGSRRPIAPSCSCSLDPQLSVVMARPSRHRPAYRARVSRAQSPCSIQPRSC